MPTFNEDIIDDLIGHRLKVLRYEAGAVTDLLRLYDLALKDVLAEAKTLAENARKKERPPNPQEVARLRKVATELRGKIRALGIQGRKDLSARLSEVAHAEAGWHATKLAIPGVSFTAIPEAAVVAVLEQPLGGGVWTDRLATDLVEAQTGIQEAIARGLARGASMDDIARMLGTIDELAGSARNRLVMIARTEVQRVSNTVAMESYAANADVVASVQYLATLDSRTCLICAPLHNQVFPLENGRPKGLERIPPLHPRCRCFLAPVTRSWSELGLGPKQAKLFDGRPAQRTSFDAWLRSHPKEAAEILGPTRLAMFEAGEPLSSFADQRRVLRVGELLARKNEA